MGIKTIRRRAQRAALFALVALCATAFGAGAAQAQATLSWTSPAGSDATAPGTLGIRAVTCASSALCVAVDDNGDVLSTTAPVSGVWGTPGLIDVSKNLSGVSCPSTTLCVATDTHGNAYASVTPTTTAWTKETAIDGTKQLNGISCPSTSLCVAVDNTGDVVTSTAPGSTAWSVQTHVDTLTTPINAISCPAADLCVAATSVGTVLVSSNPTSSGSWVSTTLASAVNLVALSCTTSGTCVVVASNGTVYATAAVATAPVTWSATPADSQATPSSVSCTDANVCVLVDHSGYALVSDAPTGSQPGWAPAQIDSHDPTLNSVYCADAGFCVAADSLGYTLTATFGPPSVSTGTGSASSQTTATLNATVAPNDVALVDCHFDYGATTGYGSSVPCTVVPNATGGAQAVTATVGGLNASTTYHFRIAASSGVATADGADASFTTPAPLKATLSISGTPAVGNTLTCKATVTTTAAETVSYQWTRDTVAIAGATAATYVVVAADETHHLACEVTVSGDGGSATSISGYDGVPSQSGATVSESVVGTAKRGADSVSAPVTCSRQSTGGCTITLALIGIATAHHRDSKVAVGSASAKLAAGAQKTLSVTLNAAGRKLLRKQHSLSVTLTISGTLIGTLKATLQTDKLTFTQKGKRLAAHRPR